MRHDRKSQKSWKIRTVLVAALAGAVFSTVAVRPGASAVSTGARGVDDKTIRVASLGYPQFYAAVAAGAKARLDLANTKKELPGGRTIDYRGLIDDKSTTEGTVAAVRQAVEQDGVFALVGTIAIFLTPDYLNQQHVPIVGYGVNDAFCAHGAKDWYLFSFVGCLSAQEPTYDNSAWPAAVLEQLGVPAKKVSAAFIGEDTDASRNGMEALANVARALGYKVVYANATIPASPTVVGDWAPYVQAVNASDNGSPPDAFFVLASTSNQIGFSTAMKQAGYKGLGTNSGMYSTALTGPATGFSSFTSWATPESAPDNAAMVKVVSALTTAGQTDVSRNLMAGWFSADMFVEILKKVGKNLTPETFQKVASKFTYEVPNTVGPTAYPQAWSAGTPCSQLVTSNGTSWSVTAKYACYDVLDRAAAKLVPYGKVRNR